MGSCCPSIQLSTPPNCPFSSLFYSFGVAFGSLFLIFKTQRKPSSSTSRFSGKEGLEWSWD